jgi:transposase
LPDLARQVPPQNSTGGKTRLGGISKRGNQYLRRLLINGASANLLRSKATNFRFRHHIGI